MDEPTPKPSRRKRILLLSAGAFLLLLGTFLLLLPTLLSSGFVREKVRAAASEATGRRIAIESLDVDWSSTVVKGLEVRWGPGEGDPVLARVGEIRVPAGITMAMASRYDVGEIEILRPEIRIDLRELAKAPTDKAAKGPAGGGSGGGAKGDSPPPPFSVKVKVREGSLVLVDLEGKERRVGGFSADVAASSEGPADATFVLDAGPGGKATFRAKASPFKGGKPVPPADLEATVEAAFEAFAPDLFGHRGSITGSVSARASGSGSVQDGKALLDVTGLAVGKIEEPSIHLEGEFNRGADGALEVRGGLLRMEGIEATASASLLPSGSVTGMVHATAALHRVVERAKRIGVPFDGFAVGEAVLDLRALSDGKADRFSGTLSFSDLQIGFGLKTTPIEEPSAKAEFDLVRTGPVWTIATLGIRSTTVEGSVTGTARQDLAAADLKATLKARLGPLLKIASSFGVPLPGEVTGNLGIEATLRRSGEAGDEAKGTLVVTDLVVVPPGAGAAPVREPRLVAEFEAVPGKESLEVRRFAWTGAGATIRAAGTARMDGSSGEFPGIEADLDLAKAAALAASFGPPLPVGLAGTASWKGSVSWKDTFNEVGTAGALLVKDLAVTLAPDRVLREAEVRATVDATVTKAGEGRDVAIKAATLAAKGIEATAAGTATADGSMDLALKGSASIPEALRRAAALGYLAKDPLTRGSLDFDLGVKGKPGDLRADVRSLAAKDAEFDLRASGAVAEKGAADLALDAGGDLATLLDLAARAGLMEPVKGAGGKAGIRGTVKAAGPDSPLRVEVTAGVEGLRYPDPAGGAPWTQKAVKAVVAADIDRKTLAATGSVDLTADDGGIRATGTADRTRLDARADLDFDAGGFCRSRPDLLPLPDMTVGRVKGGVVVKASLDGPFDPAKVDARGRLALDSVKTEPMELKDAAIDFILEKGALDARSISASVNGGKVSGSAGVGLAGAERKHFLELKAEGIRIDPAMAFVLKRAVPLFVLGEGGGVEGTFGLGLRLDASGIEWLDVKKSMLGKGSLGITDGSVTKSGILGDILELLDGGKGISFASLTTEFAVRDRRVWTDRMLVDGAEHALVISGSTAFNGDLDYRIGVKGLRLPKKTLEKIKPLLDADGSLPFTLKGNFSNPRVKGPDLKKGLKGLLGGKDE